jgi:hypothetical protein
VGTLLQLWLMVAPATQHQCRQGQAVLQWLTNLLTVPVPLCIQQTPQPNTPPARFTRVAAQALFGDPGSRALAVLEVDGKLSREVFAGLLRDFDSGLHALPQTAQVNNPRRRLELK